MMIQETGMQDGIHKKESSSGEKLHLCFSSHKNKSIAGTAGAQPDTLETTFGMENLTQRWHNQGFFPQNQVTFLDFQKSTGKAYPLPPSYPPELGYS